MGESDTVQGELDKFVDYRNEAAHSTVENVVAVEEIRKTGRFLLAVGDALSDIVELTVVERRLAQNKWTGLGIVTEVYQDGAVVVAKMSKVRLVKGETLIVQRHGGRSFKAEVVSIQVENVDREDVDAEDGQELGIRLSKRAKVGSKLLRLVPLEENKPTEIQVSPAIEIEPGTDPDPELNSEGSIDSGA
jgi:hypothetical protein